MSRKYSRRNPIKFDRNGYMIRGHFPKDCVSECAQSGQVADYVADWRDTLGFDRSIAPVRDQAIRYLREHGAWDDFGVASLETLADRVLWLACCEIKESGQWLGMVH
jgi:hypothetical protein